MRLVTYSFRGTSRLGAMSGDGEVIDLNRAEALRPGQSGEAGAADMLALLRGGDAAIEAAREALRVGEAEVRRDRQAAIAAGLVFTVAEPGFRFEAPVPRPGSVLAIGLNYKAHAAETSQDLPQYPMVFSKVASCIVGPGHPVLRPAASEALDWEGELCFVIGKRAWQVPESEALNYIAGYMIGNDVSVRDFQRHTTQYLMGKSFETHGPTGPYLVTRDEVDPSNLDVRTWVNGILKQESNTSLLIFGIPHLIAYMTQAFALEPGDVVFTGTPSGVGFSRTPPEFLKPGDTVTVEISGLGRLENPVVEAPQAAAGAEAARIRAG